MKKDLKVLYTHLMSQFQAKRLDWYNDYRAMTAAVEQLKNKLNNDNSLLINNNALFTDLELFKTWEAFLSKMFANTGNGISSNGQSIFSREMTNSAKENDEFISRLTQLVKDPSRSNHELFKETWFNVFNKNNPVQTNRATASCTINVSSTVDEGKFNRVFDWFIENNYIDAYSGGDNWYDKNVYLIDTIRKQIDKETILASNIGIDDHWISIFVWLAFENLENPFYLNKQVVKYGAPGTGKTYISKQICRLQFELWKSTVGCNSAIALTDTQEVVQFHPTFSYEDFIEGLRPVLSDGVVSLRLKNGIFKQLCKKAGVWERDLYEKDNSKDLGYWTVKKVKDVGLTGGHWDFIEDLDESTSIENVLPPYFIIIDEINRAELSAVFGELMYSLEYRGANNAIKTQYSELNSDHTGLLKINGEYKFFIPHNLYVIGTMNTIDRSVDSFDFALRRRFRWEEVHPDMDLLRMNLNEVNSEWLELANAVEKLNSAIEKEALLGKDYRLGHAYFWNLKYPKDLSIKKLKEFIWADKLGSLLEEYLRGTGRYDLIENFKKEFGL